MKKRMSSGLGVWFEEDISNVLTAVDFANQQQAVMLNNDETDTYRDGYEDAIDAIAKAFGIEIDRSHRTKRTWKETPAVRDNAEPEKGEVIDNPSGRVVRLLDDGSGIVVGLLDDGSGKEVSILDELGSLKT